MLNKELLMAGYADGMWTLRFKFTGDSYTNLTLQHTSGYTLWEGHLSDDIVTVRVPPESILILSGIFGAYDTIKVDGCRVEGARHEIDIILLQSDAYLELFLST